MAKLYLGVKMSLIHEYGERKEQNGIELDKRKILYDNQIKHYRYERSTHNK